MNNITVGESALKSVVPEWVKICPVCGGDDCSEVQAINKELDKTLSTPLPDVNDCVFINDKGELEWKRLQQ